MRQWISAMKTKTGVFVVFKTKCELKCQFSGNIVFVFITEILWCNNWRSILWHCKRTPLIWHYQGEYNSFNNYFLVCQGKFADSLNSQSQKCIHVCCFSRFGAPKQSRLYGGRHVTMPSVNIWLNAFHRVKLSLSQFHGQSKHRFPLLKGNV